MELFHERCAGAGYRQKDVKACVHTPRPGAGDHLAREIRTFATTTNALLALRDWLVAEKVSLVVLEATDDYLRGASSCLKTA